MNEKEINQQKLPVAPIVLSLVACMLGFSGATSFIVDIFSYNRIDFLTVTYMITYVAMFGATVVLTVGFCMHLRDKTNLLAIGAFILAFCYGAQRIVYICVKGFWNSGIFEHTVNAAYVAALFVFGIYYLGRRASLAYPVKMIFAVVALAVSVANFAAFLIHPEGLGDYIASFDMYAFCIYTAFLLYTPFKRVKGKFRVIG